MTERYEHHLRIRDRQGGWFLEPHQHVLWIDSSHDARGRPCYEQQRGSSKANRLEVDMVMATLLRLNNGLRDRGYGLRMKEVLRASAQGKSLRSWIEGQLAHVPAETIDDLFDQRQIKLNSRTGRPDDLVRAGDELVVDARKPVGVITFYGGQIAEIRRRITQVQSENPEAFDALDLRSNTVDRFQGMERAIIIVSLVRSRRYMRGGEFVKQYQRINVAFSRAQALLVIIGSERTFRDVVIDLPPLAGGPSREVPVYRNIYELVKRFGGRRYAKQILN